MTPKPAGTRETRANPMMQILVDMCQRLPWERLLVTGTVIGLTSTAQVTQPAQPTEAPDKPGCAAADACLLVQGYLDGLTRGNGGFGVLALGRTRLEEGASAAEGMGQHQLAIEMRAVAVKLPAVRTKEGAAEVANALRPVADKAWRLGRICGLTRKR